MLRIRIRLALLAVAVVLVAPVLLADLPAVSEAATGRPAAVGESGNMATIDVGGLPTSVAVDQATGTVWVVNSLDGTVSEISARRRVVIGVVRVAASPVDVAVDQKTGTVWVTCL